MRVPNKSVLDSLYSSRSYDGASSFSTARYTYLLFRDAAFLGYDVIQRIPHGLRSSYDQIVFKRPSCYS